MLYFIQHKWLLPIMCQMKIYFKENLESTTPDFLFFIILVCVDILYIICYNLIYKKEVDFMDRSFVNNTQIGRIDGKNCFLEIMSDMFDRNMVIINFVTYDGNTHKQTACIPVYLSIEDFLVMCEDVNFGTLSRRSLICKKNGTSEKLCEKLGGTVYNDGRVVSRVFQVLPATKSETSMFIFQAIRANGIKQSNGLITPNYKEPYIRVSVPVTESDIRGLLLKTKLRIEAFYCQQTLSGAYDKEKNSQRQNNQSNNLYSVSSGQTNTKVPQQVQQVNRRTEAEKNERVYSSNRISMINDLYPSAAS